MKKYDSLRQFVVFNLMTGKWPPENLPVKRYRLPILITEHWAWSWFRYTDSQPAGTISHLPGGRLPLLPARPVVTFPAAEHHWTLAGIKLYCLVTEAHRCKQLALGCYGAFALSRIWAHDLLIASPMLYPLLYHATNLPVIKTDTPQ